MKEKAKYLIGIDEVGRGPLAGPVTVGAVFADVSKFKKEKMLNGIKDSKKLSPRAREDWNIFLVKNFSCAVASISENIIDNIGITKALRLTVDRAIKNLKKKADFNFENCFIMLDAGLKAPKEYAQESIIKGDEKIPLISAASIVAKVARDKKMVNLHKKIPLYGFDKNKGYGTKFHINKIKECGVSKYHRKSFCRFLV